MIETASPNPNAPLEDLPEYFRGPSDERLPEAEFNPTVALQAMRTELQWAEKDGKIVEHAYALSREIGDRAIASHDPSGGVLRLLEATRSIARPATTEVGDRGGASAWHNNLTRKLGVDRELLATGGAIERSIVDSGIKLKDPADARLLALMTSVGHEAGHAVMGGIGYKAANAVLRAVPYTGLLASKLYLRQHPQEAVTGNWKTDAEVHEERSAEGYAHAVLRSSMSALGYSKREQRKALKAIEIGYETAGAPGHNLLDHIDDADVSVALSAKVEEQRADGVQQNEGALGYALPLTEKQLAAQFLELRTLSKSSRYVDNDPQTWREQVESTGQNRNIRRYVGKLLMSREAELDPVAAERRSLAKRAVGAVLLTGVIGGSAFAGGAAVAEKLDDYKVASQPGASLDKTGELRTGGLRVLTDPLEIENARQDPSVRIVE